jgi:hypothetical protein
VAGVKVTEHQPLANEHILLEKAPSPLEVKETDPVLICGGEVPVTVTSHVEGDPTVTGDVHTREVLVMAGVTVSEVVP